MNRRRVATDVLVVAAGLVMNACGTTFVDESVTTEGSGAVAVDTRPAVDPDAPIDELLAEIETLMLDLDERIVDEDGAVDTIERIDELWSVASTRISEEDPTEVVDFAQAIELARTGVERRRPADASKGYKILADVIDAYLGR